MSTKYKFLNPEGLYFVSFAVVYWIDVFVRELYFQSIVETIKYCQQHKGMKLYCYCIMPSHVHLIFKAAYKNPSELMKSLKMNSSKKLQKEIVNNVTESRREWVLWLMERAAMKKSNVTSRQFWRQDNKPIELWSAAVIDQKVDYIHNNPVEAGFVREVQDWKYSSAINYSGGQGVLNVEFV